MNNKHFEDWSKSYNEEFNLAIDAAIEVSMMGDFKKAMEVFSTLRVDRKSNAGIIARIVRLLIEAKYQTGGAELRNLIVSDASKILEDLGESSFSENDANLLGTIVVRNIKRDEEIYLKTLEQRIKFAGAKFEILLVHPKIKEFACSTDKDLAQIWEQSN